jgi:hypothetical protein
MPRLAAALLQTATTFMSITPTMVNHIGVKAAVRDLPLMVPTRLAASVNVIRARNATLLCVLLTKLKMVAALCLLEIVLTTMEITAVIHHM